jgi:hypothetical protein
MTRRVRLTRCATCNRVLLLHPLRKAVLCPHCDQACTRLVCLVCVRIEQPQARRDAIRRRARRRAGRRRGVDA